jgi:hypothetical protein
MSVDMYVYVCTYMFTYVYMWGVRTYVYLLRIYVVMYVLYSYVCMYVCLHIRMNMYIRTYVRVYVYKYLCLHLFIVYITMQRSCQPQASGRRRLSMETRLRCQASLCGTCIGKVAVGQVFHPSTLVLQSAVQKFSD